MSETGRSRLKIAAAVAGVAAIGIVATGIVIRASSERSLAAWTQEQAVPTVSVIHPQVAAASDALRLPANLQALNSAPIYARTTGYVQRWLVDLGDTVRRGQVLAILDAPDVEQQLAAARADLQTARANQQLAQTTATRWSAMLAKDAVSKQEADEKQGDLAAKSALTNAARANVARLQALTGFTRLVAPFDGVVTSRATQIGALVVAGTLEREAGLGIRPGLERAVAIGGLHFDQHRTRGGIDGKVVEVIAGLAPGDRVIDNPPDSLQTGDRVKVIADARK